MRKAYIYHNIPEGGAMNYLRSVVGVLSNNEFELHLFRIEGSGTSIDEQFKDLNIVSARFKKFPILNLFESAYNAQKIAKKIRLEGSDIVILAQDMTTKSPYLLSLLNSSNLFYICHELPREYIEPAEYHAPRIKDKIYTALSYPVCILDKLNVTGVKKIITCSTYSKSVIDLYYSTNSFVIYPCVNTNYFAYSSARRDKRIVSIGSLLPFKGHDILIRAISLLGSDYSLEIVGNGRDEERKYLIDLARKMGVILNIRSNLNQDALRRVISESILLASAAYKEPFGISIIEAISCGTPVIVSRGGGMGEQVGGCGLIVNRDPEGFAKGIKSIMGNYKMYVKSCLVERSLWTQNRFEAQLTNLIK